MYVRLWLRFGLRLDSRLRRHASRAVRRDSLREFEGFLRKFSNSFEAVRFERRGPETVLDERSAFDLLEIFVCVVVNAEETLLTFDIGSENSEFVSVVGEVGIFVV